jgi:hypothetical protein
MKYRLIPVIFSVLLILTFSGCSGSGGGEFVFDVKETEILNEFSLGNYSSYIAAAESGNGYYLLSMSYDREAEIYTTELSFTDDSGIKRSNQIFAGNFYDDMRYYLDVWQKDGRLYTAYITDGEIYYSENLPHDLFFEEYDENFNLIKSVKVDTLPAQSETTAAFDGEYFYYNYDDTASGPDVAYPNDDMKIVRLNGEFEVVDSVNPSDSRYNPSRILKLALAADGKIYTIYSEAGYFGTTIKMKAFGENEKAVKIKGIPNPEQANSGSVRFANYGDENFISYISANGMPYSGVNADGTLVPITDTSEKFLIDKIFYSIPTGNGNRVSFTADFRTANSDTRTLVKTEFSPVGR